MSISIPNPHPDSIYHLPQTYTTATMPLYDVEYICPLTPTQQENLAIALTNLHAQRFHTPRCFINVRYTDASNQVVFRGGVRRRYNRIIVRTRAGDNRPREVYIEHCRAIVGEWERIVGKEGEEGIRTVWVMGALTAAVEAGIARPKVKKRKKGEFFSSTLWRQI